MLQLGWTGRYATAPNYGATLNNVIETYNLTQYDTAPTSTSPMYRLYNRHTGAFVYIECRRKNYLPTVGWEYEGIALASTKQWTACLPFIQSLQRRPSLHNGAIWRSTL